MPKTALIFGITGQDGSYLAELLLEHGYRVAGLVRHTSHPNLERIEHITDRLELLPGDLLDDASISAAVQAVQPDEIYNLASQSFVPTSWNQPVLTADVNALGVIRILEAIRSIRPQARFYQASTSEMFGSTPERPLKETSPFSPCSPYAFAKLHAHWATVAYRQAYGLFACSGICFNHESPRRGLEFVTRKVTDGVARIKLGLSKKLPLGRLHIRRDWGFAGDHVRAMWLMLQRDTPQDYVVATGTSHSVEDLVRLAFQCVALNFRDFIFEDPKLFRPGEVQDLVGDSSKAQRELGWRAEVSFERLIQMMVEADLERVKKNLS